MSKDPDDLLEELAALLADGAPIDWNKRLQGLEPGDRSLAEGLRRVAVIQQSVRRPETEPGSVDPGHEIWRWGHLEIGALLGEGSFGKVYRAYDTVLHRDVALKLRIEPSAGSSTSSFLGEARRLARVRHPNVLAVHGADVHDGRAGLWSDLLEGATLEELLERASRVELAEVVTIAGQLCSALEAVHQAGLVHGDVKASNVIRTTEGQIVLMDFGAGRDTATSTAHGPVAGSPLSMAPELLAGGAATPASDQYALGVLLFRLVTGRYPIAADTLEQLQSRHRDAEGPRWQDQDPSGRALRTLIDRLLSRDPAERPMAPEAGAMVDAIASEPVRRRRRLAIVAIVASLAVASVASTLGWWFATRSAQRADAARREAVAVSTFLTDLLLAPDISRRGPEVRVLDVMDEARRLAEASWQGDPLIQARVFWLVGRVKASLGKGDEALPILSAAEDAFDTAGAPLERIEVEIRRARLLIERAEHEQAEALLGHVEREPAMSAATPSLRLQWTRTRAYLLAQKGDLDEAEATFRAALEIGSQVSERDFQMARLELAIVLGMQGRMAEAEEQYREHLAWAIRELGEENENTLLVRSNLAGLIAQTGRYAEAEELFRHNAEAARTWLGPEHRLYLLSATGLAEVLGEQGRFDEAAVLDAETIPLANTVWGESHPRTLILRANIAGRLIAAGQYEEAEALLVPTIRGLSERRGPDASPTLHAQMSLVEVLLRTGRPGEAEPIARDVLDRATESLGPDSPVALGIASRLARSLIAIGQVDEGLSRLREALSNARRVFGPDQFDVLTAQLELGKATGAAGLESESRELFCDAEGRLRRSVGPDDPRAREARALLEAAGGCLSKGGA